MVIWGDAGDSCGVRQNLFYELPMLLAFRYPELGLAKTVSLKLWVVIPRVLDHPFIGVA